MADNEPRPQQIQQSRPSPTYEGYINIDNDPNGEIAAKRLEILQHGRNALTHELALNTPFYLNFQEVYDSGSGERDTFTQDQIQKLTTIKRDIPRLAEEVLGRPLEEGERELLRLNETADVFFTIAQHMPGLYLDFARDMIEKTKELGIDLDDPKLVYLFSGRDSFPFLMGYRELEKRRGLDVKDIYAPFNRVGFQKFFGTRENEIEFLKDLEHFYSENGIDKSRMLVVDFGFIGSLERINQIILPDSVKPEQMYHFLFTSFKKKGAPPWFLERLRSMNYSTTSDEEHVNHETFGYLNALVERHSDDPKLMEIMTGGMDPNIDWKPYLNPFSLFLQEMGAGVNESRQDSLSTGNKRAYKGTHLKFAHLQQFIAVQAYLEGLSIALPAFKDDPTDESAITSLKYIYELFNNNKPFFQEFIPQEDRRHIPEPKSSPIFMEVTADLEHLKTIPISTVKPPPPQME